MDSFVLCAAVCCWRLCCQATTAGRQKASRDDDVEGCRSMEIKARLQFDAIIRRKLKSNDVVP